MGRVSAKVPIRKLSATDDVYDRGFHKGDPGGLDAVDTDLAVGNIKDGETIFGKLGTFAGGPLVEDVLGDAQASGTCSAVENGNYGIESIPGESDSVAKATKTLAFAAGSMAVAVGTSHGISASPDCLKMRLFMEGVQVAESAFLDDEVATSRVLVGTRAMSGSRECYAILHNYNVAARSIEFWNKAEGDANVILSIGVGSIKT